jgi:hypothetical protein
MTVDRREAGRLVQVLETQTMRQAKFGHHNHVTNLLGQGVNCRRGSIRLYRQSGGSARKVREL